MTAARDLAARLAPTRAASEQALPDPSMVKYTLLMSVDDADSLDHLLLRVRRTHGRRVTKSQLIRNLIRLSVTDATLLDQALSADLVLPVDDRAG